MSNPFIGQIIMFGSNFAPRGWALCDGQLLPIASNTALFSILGTTYGGDGRTTFALPDLKGRVPMHAGNGPGLTPRRLGEKSGQENVVLNSLQIPSHAHTLNSTQAPIAVHIAAGNANVLLGNGNALANRTTDDDGSGTAGDQMYNSDGALDNALKAGSAAISGASLNAGGSQQHNNLMPFQVVNYIIALQGTFPSRS